MRLKILPQAHLQPRQNDRPNDTFFVGDKRVGPILGRESGDLLHGANRNNQRVDRPKGMLLGWVEYVCHCCAVVAPDVML